MKKHLVLCVSLLSLAITGCKDDVVFDQKTYDEMVKKAFVVENVDPDHQWATMGAAEATVSVNTGTGDQYKVMIYDGDPIASKGTLKLLGEGKVTDGSSLDMKISYPMAKAYAYVTLFDSQNYMSVFPALIENGRLKVAVNNTQSKKAKRRTIQPSYDFPSDADASKFLADVPAGVSPYTGGYASGTSYIENRTSDVNIWGNWDGSKTSGGTLYIKGYCDFTNANFYVAGNTEIYLVEGATLKLNANAAGNLQTGSNIYIAKNAKILAEGSELKLNNGLHIYNHGTIVANKLSTNSNSLLVNGGTVTIATTISVENELSVIVNNGTITATDLNTAGSGKFQNNNNVTISNNTLINSNRNAWVNNGQYRTKYFLYLAGSDDVINNCRLIVDEDFDINLGDNAGDGNFKMDGGSSVVTKNFNGGAFTASYYRADWYQTVTMNFQGGPFYIYMGEGSIFEVTETATMDATKANYGFYGPETGDYAVLHAKKIVAPKANQGFEVTYGGHLYVATDDHFAFGYSDKTPEQQAAGEVGVQPYYDLRSAEGAILAGYNGAKVTLSDQGCGAAYTGTPDEGEHPSTPLSYRYCFEDNFPDVGDYDFNDVVLTVTPSVNDRTLTVQVSLDAVGATKTIAAAMRLMGVQKDDLESYEVVSGFPSPDNQGLGTYNNIDTDKTFLPENEAPNNSSSMVVVLFKDAHWALNPVKASNGGVQRLFYNTVDRKEGEHNSANVDPVVATYTFVFKDADKANTMLAQNLYDVFIVQPYGGGFWEVHTVQNGFKTAQVVTPIKPAGYAEAYGSNMPWAIVVPGDFKYPIEWKVIGARKNGTLEGAYEMPGHSFAEWAEDSSQATDWYLYPTAGSVYE